MHSYSSTLTDCDVYHASRDFALYDDDGLVVVTVYKRGTEAVRQRQEADTRTIEDLQRQLADLTQHFREQATVMPPHLP